MTYEEQQAVLRSIAEEKKKQEERELREMVQGIQAAIPIRAVKVNGEDGIRLAIFLDDIKEWCNK